jgi:hypothetical protein
MEPQSAEPAIAPKSDAKKDAPPGAFGRLFSFLFASNDPERQKQKLLKQLSKELKKSRPKYFNPLTASAEPPLARFFYELYKAFSPAQVLLRGARESGVLKSIVVELSMTPDQVKRKEMLTEKFVEERAKNADPLVISAQIKEEAHSFIGTFEVTAINEIDAVYNRLAVLLDLVVFDYPRGISLISPASRV